MDSDEILLRKRLSELADKSYNILAELFNKRCDLNALDRKALLISAELLAAKAQHHALAVRSTAKLRDRQC